MGSQYFIFRDQCPVCESRDARELYDSAFDKPPVRVYLDRLYRAQGEGVEYAYLSGGRFAVVACRFCGLVYQRYAPSDELMQRLYGHWIRPEKIFPLDAKKPHAQARREAELLVLYLGRGRDKDARLSVYDYGMGWGIWLTAAACRGCDVFGTELIGEKCAVASSFGVRCFRDVEMAGKSFDLVFAENVMEDVRSRGADMVLLSGALKPHGLLRIVVPVSTFSRVRRRLERFARGVDGIAEISPLEHLNCFCGDSLRVLAENAGLVKVTLPLSLRYRMYSSVSLKGMLKPALSGVSYRFMPVFFRRR